LKKNLKTEELKEKLIVDDALIDSIGSWTTERLCQLHNRIIRELRNRNDTPVLPLITEMRNAIRRLQIKNNMEVTITEI